MKNWMKKQALLILLLLVGIGAALGVILQRVETEQANKTYDMIMDYSSLEEMANVSEQDIEYWLSYFRQLGLDKLAIREETISSLVTEYQGLIQAQSPGTICAQYGWQNQYPEPVQQQLLNSRDSSDMLVTIEDMALYNWVKNAFTTRTDEDIWMYEDENGDGFLFLTGDGTKVTGTKLMSLSLGLDPEKQQLGETYGYTLIPRTTIVEDLNGDTFAEAVLQEFEDLNSPYMMNGRVVLGEDNPETAYTRMLSYLETHDMALGIVENSTQSMNQVGTGMEQVIEASGYDALRVFTMWDYVQWRYGWYNYDGPEEITNCLYRAAYERNCRLIYFKMILKENPAEPETYDYVTDPAAYDTLLGDFMDRMNQRGFSMETMTAAQPVTVSFLSLVLIAMGAVAGAVLLLGLVLPLPAKWSWVLGVLGSLAATGVLYVMPNTGRLILSIGGGIVMPLLALVLLDRMSKRTTKMHPLLFWLLALLAVVGLCLVGGLFGAAPLSDSAYMMELKLYRGVKVMQLVPMAGFVIYLLKEALGHRCRQALGTSRETRRQQLQKLMDTNIKVRYLVYFLALALVLTILGVIGSYYLARTGHTENVGVADLELELRNWMEYYLLARPRTKEFLIGYPCVLLYLWARRKNTALMNGLSLIFGLGAAIGATSIVNTFLHIRTAYLISLIRVFIGLGAGLVIGLIVLALAQLIYRAIAKRTKYV